MRRLGGHLLVTCLVLWGTLGTNNAAISSARNTGGLLRHRVRRTSMLIGAVPKTALIDVGNTDACEHRQHVPPCFKELLTCANAFFRQEKYPYFITAGTLLGQVRKVDGKSLFLPWDDDIDTTICTHKMGNKLPADMSQKFEDTKDKLEGDPCANVSNIAKISDKKDANYRMYHKFCKHCKYGKTSPQWLDIDNEQLMAVNAGNKTRSQIRPHHIHPIHDCDLEGVKVRCPHKSEEFIEKWYGQNWREPFYSEFRENPKDKKLPGTWMKNPKVAAKAEKEEADLLALQKKAEAEGSDKSEGYTDPAGHKF